MYSFISIWSFQVTLAVNNLPVNAGDERDVALFPGEENGKPFQYSCQESSRDRGV